MSSYKVKLPDEMSKITVIRDKIMKLGGQTIIFMRTKSSALVLHEALVEGGYAASTTRGDRDKIMKEFKDGLIRVLISTDIIGRGFDQSQVNLVVNYDLPVIFHNPTEPDIEVYLHSIAGLAGGKGAVFNLVCGDRDNMIMEKIERRLNRNVIEVSWTSDDFKDALKNAGLM